MVTNGSKRGNITGNIHIHIDMITDYATTGNKNIHGTAGLFESCWRLLEQSCF